MSVAMSSLAYSESANKFYALSKSKNLFCNEQDRLEDEQILAIATYIEKNLSEWDAVKKDCRVGKEQTGLARTIFYQAANKRAYIKLSSASVKGAMIMYDPENPLRKNFKDVTRRC